MQCIVSRQGWYSIVCDVCSENKKLESFNKSIRQLCEAFFRKQSGIGTKKVINNQLLYLYLMPVMTSVVCVVRDYTHKKITSLLRGWRAHNASSYQETKGDCLSITVVR